MQLHYEKDENEVHIIYSETEISSYYKIDSNEGFTDNDEEQELWLLEYICSHVKPRLDYLRNIKQKQAA